MHVFNIIGNISRLPVGAAKVRMLLQLVCFKRESLCVLHLDSFKVVQCGYNTVLTIYSNVMQLCHVQRED